MVQTHSNNISLIAACDLDGMIGCGGKMPWVHFPEDMEHFRSLTLGHTVIMGRRTFQSIGRPLPDRENIVLTSLPAIDGCTVAASAEEALEKATCDGEIFVIGGEMVFREFMDRASKIHLTRIGHRWKGDRLFPPIDPGLWCISSREQHPGGANFPYPYEFIEYTRR